MKIDLHMKGWAFKTRFEKEVWENSEMAYYLEQRTKKILKTYSEMLRNHLLVQKTAIRLVNLTPPRRTKQLSL